jgi:hypothetical protein
MIKTCICFAISYFLVSCTPANLAYNTPQEDQHIGFVHIARRSTLLFIAIPVIFGYDGKDRAIITNGRFQTLKVPTGKHEFFVRSDQADRPYKVSYEVNEGEKICFETYPNGSYAKKIFLFFTFYFSSAFTLKKVHC